MNIPGSRAELEAMGFVFQRRTKCGSEICGATIEWWTGPSNRWIPFRLHPRTGKLIQHADECPGKKEFRTKPVEVKSAKPEKLKPEPVSQTGRLF
jgi:hypothetical protein